MIRAKTLRIQEFRGIRDLTLHFEGKNFAICGPNGTGKSGVVDALEFVLTGNISRLSGAGTGGLSVRDHGPHVDSRNKPEQALVTLSTEIPSLNKEVTISRSVKDAKRLTIDPDGPDVRAVLNRVALHPEFTLSRRELIRYVLAEPSKRAKEVQELLRLEEVETIRGLLQRIANAAARDAETLANVKGGTAAALRGALALTKLTATDILTAANEKRAILSSPAIPALEANTSIKDGVISTAAAAPPRISKLHAKTDTIQLRDRLADLVAPAFVSLVTGATSAIADLAHDENFLESASREALLRAALAAFDSQVCSVCDTPWKAEEFRRHLAHKLDHFSAVAKQRKAAEEKLRPVIASFEALQAALESVVRVGGLLIPQIDCNELSKYATRLAQARDQVRRFLPLNTTVDALSAVTAIPAAAVAVLNQVEAAVSALPEPSQQDAARDFPSVGQEKLEAYRQASLKLKAAEQQATTSRFVVDHYGKVTEGVWSTFDATGLIVKEA